MCCLPQRCSTFAWFSLAYDGINLQYFWTRHIQRMCCWKVKTNNLLACCERSLLHKLKKYSFSINYRNVRINKWLYVKQWSRATFQLPSAANETDMQTFTILFSVLPCTIRTVSYLPFKPTFIHSSITFSSTFRCTVLMLILFYYCFMLSANHSTCLFRQRLCSHLTALWRYINYALLLLFFYPR